MSNIAEAVTRSNTTNVPVSGQPVLEPARPTPPLIIPRAGEAGKNTMTAGKIAVREVCCKRLRHYIGELCENSEAPVARRLLELVSGDELDDESKLALVNHYTDKQPTEPDSDSEPDPILSHIIDSDAFMRTTIPKPPELIKGVLYQGDKMSLNASSKIGKTWHLLKLGLSVSEGLDWLGLKTTKSKVLFVNFELRDYVIQDRIIKIKNAILPNAVTNNFFVLNMRNLNKSPEELMAALLNSTDTLKQQQFGMIIFDPLYKMYGNGLDENSAGDVAGLLNRFETLSRKAGASIVYSHHYAKGGQAGKDSIDRASGSGVFARDPDAIVNITALEDDANTSYRVDMQLRCFKPVKPFGIRINEGRISLDSSLNLNNIRKPGQFKTQYTERDILKVLQLKPQTTTELMEAVKIESGMKQAKFYELWKSVKKMAGVSEDKDKKWFYAIPACNPTNN